MKKIWIVEPHGDDVLYSCPELLFPEPGRQVIVTTFLCDKTRLDTAYAKHFGMHIHNLVIQIPEIMMEHAYLWHHDPLYQAKCTDCYHSILAGYGKFFDVLLGGCNQVYFPWGIEHPHHCQIADYFHQLYGGSDKVRYYLDRPYWDVASHLAWRPLPDRKPDLIYTTPSMDRQALVTEIMPPHFITNGDKIKDSRYYRSET